MPTGVPISLDDIKIIAQNIGGFLFVLGGILAGITIIVSGIAYFTAGSNPSRIKTAKDILKAGIIGAFVIFGAGFIIATIKGFTSDPLYFFRDRP